MKGAAWEGCWPPAVAERPDGHETVGREMPSALRGVPRAMYYRYLKRIVANLASVTATLADGIDRTVDLDE